MNTLFLLKEKTETKVIHISTDRLSPNAAQPRKSFDGDALESLAQSIRENGILQPLLVRKDADGRYQLVAGERRLRAAVIAGLDEVPCILLDINERSSAVYALVENLQRQNLDFFDEAEAIRGLIAEFGLTQEDVALRLGRSQPSVANKLRLLRLSDRGREEVARCMLTERHARALLRLPDEDLQMKALERVERCRLNVTATEKLVDKLLEGERDCRSIIRRKGILGDVRLFVNTINRAVEIIQTAGIPADSHRHVYDEYTEYVIRIPNNVSRETN